MSNDARPLPIRQQRFVAEYVSCLNGRQAAIRAGYSPRTADVKASQLLAIPAVASAVATITAAHMKRLEVTREKVLQEIATIAYADEADYYRLDALGRPILDLSNLPPGASKAIAEVTNELIEGGENRPDIRKVKIKLHSKNQALDMLGKYLALFQDKGGSEKDDQDREEDGKLATRLRAALERRRLPTDGGSPEGAKPQ